MYVTADTVDAATLYQGDIIADLPFFIFEKNQAIKKNDEGLYEEDNTEPQDRSLFALEAKKQKMIILSQTCDVQRRTHVIVCPVYPLAEFITDRTINTKNVESIRARKNNYLFYLPAFESFPESIADFQTMTYVPRSVLQIYLLKREITLSDLGRHHLAWSLATYFGRPHEN